MTRILLLEDDISLIDGLEYSLQKNGFDVETVRTVKEALNRLFQSTVECPPQPDTTPVIRDLPPRGISFTSKYDLLILDVTLPDGTGFEVCEKVREQNKQLPIIFLTAADEEVNIIRGLDCGGDDYITKPFKIGELCSRIHALLRRTKLTFTANTASAPHEMSLHKIPFSDTVCDTSTIVSGGIVIDLASCRVSLHGKPLELTMAEYRLLSLLIQNKNNVVTRDLILDKLWDGTGDFVDDNTLSVYVRRLREKIEIDPSHPLHLLTVRGFGYKWKEDTGT